MLSSRKVWLGLIAVIAAIGASVLAPAQGYPTLQGDNARTGKNVNPVLYGPGFAGLVWFWPNGINRPTTLRRDNMSIDTVRFPGTASWTVPPIDQEALYFFDAPRKGTPLQQDYDGSKAFDPFRALGPKAPYEYTVITNSNPYPTDGSKYDPTTTPNLKTFTWTIDPTHVDPPKTDQPANYQLYVWLPNGPTGTTIGGLQFPSRYYVYKVFFGNGQTFTDIVDTNVAGQGWVRLGNGGLATNMVFSYVPGTPIQIRLYAVRILDQLNQFLDAAGSVVYADAAMAVPDNGYNTSTPTISQITTPTGTRNQVVQATNLNQLSTIDGETKTVTTPILSAFPHDGLGATSASGSVNVPYWTWTPLEVTPFTTFVDNSDPEATIGGTWTNSNLVNHFGANYATHTLSNNPAVYDSATYAPTLDDGDYLVQVYCGGDGSGELYGNQTTVMIHEGGVLTQFQIDQSQPGWITVGTIRFKNRASIAQPLSVEIRSYSPFAGDTGKLAFADNVRFIGAFNVTINSTPVQTKAFVTPKGGGAPVEKDVVVVACDDGHVYCLDANGNGNGTTTVYWAYPSILPTGTLDPNRQPTLDGDGTNIVSKMPTSGFGLGSPLVQRIGGNDYCYVAARNGRVYCIQMDGRGDFDPGTGKVGTTTRQWTFPNDWPAPVTSPALDGGFGGSVSYGPTPGNGTIYVPAMEGRLYALDPIGGPNRTTTTRWTFPARNVQNLGGITTTPTVDFGRVYFGTARRDDTTPGQFYALDANSGLFRWVFEGVPSDPADNFIGGPCTATAAQVGAPSNMIFCSNDNLFTYGLNADTGAALWSTNELNTPVHQHLMFTWLSVPNQAGTNTPFPLVMVPTDDGRFQGLFANPADVNLDNLRLAWGYISASDTMQASMSNGFNFMYGADMAGFLYAWSATGTVGQLGETPGGEQITVNNPIAQEYRNAKIKFLNRNGYVALRQSNPADPSGDLGTQDYSLINNAAYLRSLDAFEWGETAYICVYDFPFDKTDPNDDPITPPIVNFQIGVEGASVRQYGVQAKQWASGAPANMDGYAILAFPIQGSGPTSIPPGGANIKISFSTSASNTVGRVENIPVAATRSFTVANPIGIYMPDPTSGAIGTGSRTFGINPNPTTPERKVNGTPNIPLGTFGTRMAQTEGVVGNGQTGVGSFWVVDMSMLTLLKGPERGLEGVRVTPGTYAWQGGAAAVVKPLNILYYPLFEDYPENFPNTSIDYPNIGREALRVTKDPNGIPENAITSTNGNSLVPPKPYDENNIQARTIHPVLYEIDVDVPRFQPANNDPNRTFLDSAGSLLPSGYVTRLNVFVDSNGNAVADQISGRREAYRAWTSTLAVAVDDRISVITPTVDLGTLAEGTGYSPAWPGNGGNSMSPWIFAAANYGTAPTSTNQDYVDLFKTFHVQNLGNVNLLNLRLAKGVVGGPADGPWPIYSNSVDELGWLNSEAYVYTNFDQVFQLLPEVSLQKSRVGAREPNELSTNPLSLLNQNLGSLPHYAIPGGPTGNAALPRIAVAPPIGFPIGLYSQRMVIVDDLLPLGSPFGNNLMDVNSSNESLESMSNPSFELKFLVREARATNDFTKVGSPGTELEFAL